MLRNYEPCANESALRAHLAGIDRDQRRLFAIQKHADNLLATTNKPSITANAMEALDEFIASQPGNLLRHITKGLEADNRDEIQMHAEQIGMLILAGVRGHWETYSRNEAENDINDSCHNCFGEGCKQCGYEG